MFFVYYFGQQHIESISGTSKHRLASSVLGTFKKTISVLKYFHRLSPRLKYMLIAISSPEEELMNLGVTVGILGMHRSLFDIMLHPLPPSHTKSKSKNSVP